MDAPFLIVFFFLPALLVGIDFLKFLITGSRLFNWIIIRLLELVCMLGLPFLYLLILDGTTNDCCSDSATFSPEHKLTIYVLIGLCIVAYFYSTLKKNIASPILEVLVNVFLLLGIALNIVIVIQIEEPIWLIGNLPIIQLFILQLVKNHKLFIRLNSENIIEADSFFERTSWKILSLKLLLKIPILFILCLPVLTFIASLLLLFGQKPDSMIKAFTDTYKHGFSQLDHLCDNVQCGDHFLCSVAAKGHKGIVRPIRYGERNNHKIICNRQLLVANAFEELIAQKMPKLHAVIRGNYNKVGNVVHQYYYIFENKLVADSIYLLMKPMELLFLVTLYTFDVNPENRIAKQYIGKEIESC